MVRSKRGGITTLAAVVAVLAWAWTCGARDTWAGQSTTAAGPPVVAGPERSTTPTANAHDAAAAKAESDQSPTTADHTRAFVPPSVEATQDAVRGIWIVGAIGCIGVLLIVLGAAYLCAPRAWQQRYRPTVIDPTPPIPPAELERHWGDKDRWDMEAEIGDFLQDLERGDR